MNNRIKEGDRGSRKHDYNWHPISSKNDTSQPEELGYEEFKGTFEFPPQDMSTGGLTLYESKKTEKEEKKSNKSSIWMSSSNYPLFFYQPNKTPDKSPYKSSYEGVEKTPNKTTDKIEAMAEQLSKSLHLEDNGP